MVTILCFDITQLNEGGWAELYRRASPERRARADRYRKPEDRRRCLAAEALLRYALGSADYAVEKNQYGKPRIAGREDFHFNLSHTGNWVVIAFGDAEVGIDIEQISRDAGKERLARRFFTENEQAYVFWDAETQAERFFEIWTAKESYLKYLGTGLSKALDSFDVLTMEDPACRRIPFADGYCLSLCTRDDTYSLSYLTGEQLLQT